MPKTTTPLATLDLTGDCRLDAKPGRSAMKRVRRRMRRLRGLLATDVSVRLVRSTWDFARGIKRDNPPKRNRARSASGTIQIHESTRRRQRSVPSPSDAGRRTVRRQGANHLHRRPEIAWRLLGKHSAVTGADACSNTTGCLIQTNDLPISTAPISSKLGRVLPSLVCCLPGAREPPPKTGGVRLQPKER